MNAYALVLAALVFLMGFGDRFIYHPVRYPQGDWKGAEERLRPEDRFFEAADGTRLHAFWVPREGARATLLYLHGNGGNVTSYAGFVVALGERLGVNVLLPDYRGYGRSEGTPSEDGLYQDAEAAWAELTGPLGRAPGEIVIYGLSLGTAVATELAVRHPEAAGLILEAPFTSMRAMVERSVPFLDPGTLVDSRYETVAKVARLRMPLLVVHGTADRAIPIAMGRAVFEAAREPKDLLEVEGAGHVNCPRVGGARYFERLGALLERGLAARPGSSPAPARPRERVLF